MKKFLVFLILFYAAASLRAQQLAPLEQSRQNQVLTNRAEHPLYFWTGPSGATPFFPAYVPDSLKCGAVFNVTSTSGGYTPGLYTYNCTTSQWAPIAGASISTATDANYTVSTSGIVKLPLITAARTVTLPAASAFSGATITIWNKNTSNTYSWSFAGTNVKDPAMNTITNLINASFYVLISDGTDWIKTN